MIHDIESYIITIKRKGTAVQAPAVVASAPAVASVEPLAPAAAVDSTAPVNVTRTAAKPVVSPLPGVVVDVKVAAGVESLTCIFHLCFNVLYVLPIYNLSLISFDIKYNIPIFSFIPY